MIFFFGQKIKTSKFVYKLLLSRFGVGLTELSKLMSLFGFSFKSTLLMFSKIKLRLLENFCYSRLFFGTTYFRKYFYGQRLLTKLGTYRGRRLILGLPTHGQRTHTNAKNSRHALIKM